MTERIEYAAIYIPSLNVVIIGSRHEKCNEAGIKEYRKKWNGLKKQQGFLTNKSRFLNRQFSAGIAMFAGQITEETFNLRNRILHSEDCIKHFEYTRIIKNFNP